MWYKITRKSREARDLNRVFLQLKDVSVRFVADSRARDVKMVGPKGTVPVGRLYTEVSNETRDGASGVVRGKGDKEEVSFFWILGHIRTVLKSGVEEGFGGRIESEGLVWFVYIDFEISDHFLVIWEEGSG